MAVFFEGARRRAAVIADAAACGAVSWDSESWAGEMLQPAGYRPAGAWVRAGAGLRGAGGSVGMSCVRFALVLRFWRGVLCSSCACHTFLLECLLRLIYACRAALSECLMFDHAYCLPHGAKQDGLRNVAFLFRRGSRSPFVRSQVAVRLSDLAGSLRVFAFLCGDPDGGFPDKSPTGTPKKSRRRPESLLGEGQTLNRSYILAP